MSASDDPDVARAWYDSLVDAGVEGVVAKRATSTYRAGRSSSWQKVRHAETVDADVVGYTGPALRPKALAARLPDGRTALTQKLTAPLAALVGPHLAATRAGRASAHGRRGQVHRGAARARDRSAGGYDAAHGRHAYALTLRGRGRSVKGKDAGGRAAPC
ncbi:hypothetical protein E4K10_04690 [Streptomyces sp. T1317-0309]|nr:hypothetical protein E4K10_04690 [Streptomyces sp. T1317-0309]